jgi:pilus assembly protein CpaB
MNTSRLIILAVAVLAAGAAGYIAMTMNDAPPPAIEVSTPAPALPVKDVLTASSNLAVGSSLSGQLQWQSWPESSLSPDYITRDAQPEALDDLQKSSLRLPVLAGEPIRKLKLIGEGESLMSSLLPKGMRAIATNIAAESSAGGFILPGDRVDVFSPAKTAILSHQLYRFSRKPFWKTSAFWPLIKRSKKMMPVKKILWGVQQHWKSLRAKLKFWQPRNLWQTEST